MSPETIKKLSENVPEFVELRTFLTIEAHKLNTLEGLDTLSFEERALETTARLRAYQKLLSILGELSADMHTPQAPAPSEYAV